MRNRLQLLSRPVVGSLMLLLMLVSSCTLPRWRRPEPCVFDPGVTKTELVAHLNRNILGDENQSGLRSWRSSAVRLHVDGVPVALPGSIAVEAPQNFRLLVSNPLSGGQEVDIGSNQERFWIWSKDSPEVLTASHDDITLALQELQMPVHLHPAWLMEVFGVIPLDADEFEMQRPDVENGLVELVARRQSPLGEDVERVIRVNVCRGRITEHLLRLPGGKILARARMENHQKLDNGSEFAQRVSLIWPDVQMRMVMEIRDPEVNFASTTSTASMWEMPRYGRVVDIGIIARAHAREMGRPPVPTPGKTPSVTPVHHEAIPRKPLESATPLPDSQPARIRLIDRLPRTQTKPDSSTSTNASLSASNDEEIPEWARGPAQAGTAPQSPF